MEEYQYKALDRTINAFRLLAILPAWRGSSRLHCELLHADLDDLSSTGFSFYEAISYTWGDLAEKEGIVLDGKHFSITQNLAAALRRFRTRKSYRNFIRVVWVDSICINQNDLIERRDQIQKMKQIYGQAAQVLVWLGPASEDSARAMDVIEYMTNADTSDDWIAKSMLDPAQQPTWHAIARLFARPFWRRVWVRQEIAMAKEIMVMCGTRKVKWPTMVLACDSLYKERDILEPISQGISKYTSGFHQVLFIETMREYLAENDAIDFEHMLFHNRACESTDARDRVYATLGLVSDTVPGVQPDYLLSKEQVYTTAVCAQITQRKSLNILSGCQYSIQAANLPSWVPDFENDIKAPLLRSREGYESLYNAGGGIPLKFNIIYDNAHYVLLAQGIAWDVVLEVGPECNSQLTPAIYKTMTSWNQLAQRTLKSSGPFSPGTSRYEIFWRTLIADQDIFGNRAEIDTAPEEGHRSFLLGSEQVKQSIPDLSAEGWYNEERFSIFSDRLTEVAEGRSLFSTRRGHIGMGCDALPGDLVCILFGADLPFLLRRHQDGYVIVCETCKSQFFYHINAQFNVLQMSITL